MGIVDALCSHEGCGKVIRWQSGDPRLCVEHGGMTYKPRTRQLVEVDMPMVSTETRLATKLAFQLNAFIGGIY